MVNLFRREPGPKRIGVLLVEAGLISESQLSEALEKQRATGGKVVEILISLGFLTTRDFTRFLARQGMPAVNLDQYEIPKDLISLIPAETAARHRVIPIDKLGKHLTIAMECPLDGAAIAEIEEATQLKARPVLCSPEDVRAALEHYYGALVEEELDEQPVEHTPDNLSSAEPRQAASADAAPPSSPSTPSDAPEPQHEMPEGLQELEAPLRLQGVGALVRQLDSLPTLPDTVGKVQEAVNRPDSGAREIGNIIASDPPLAAKLLSVVNSPSYGLSQTVEDIGLAVSLLGVDDSCNIVFSAAVLNVMGNAEEADHRSFWRKALRCAKIARSIGQMRGSRRTGALFSAGLLHDIGQLALFMVAPESTASVPAHVMGAERLRLELEKIGLTHPEAGYYLAEHWNLPEDIANAIRFHHEPEHAEVGQELVAVVSVADTLSQAEALLARQCSSALDILDAGHDLLGHALGAEFFSHSESAER
jgi:HD-like signal output (HDOD) protein